MHRTTITKITHIFPKEAGLHYIEPEWCDTRLFEVEKFPGLVWDPFAGSGRIIEAARAAGYQTRATDIADRGYPLDEVVDVLTVYRLDPETSLVANPPFEDEILQHVIGLNPVKAAMIWPLARLVAAWPWLADAPLAHIWLLTLPLSLRLCRSE
jgi:hypothetical protein